MRPTKKQTKQDISGTVELCASLQHAVHHATKCVPAQPNVDTGQVVERAGALHGAGRRKGAVFEQNLANVETALVGGRVQRGPAVLVGGRHGHLRP